jgi:demethylmenaquinone methyltransferase/2-methoxy-6-polyprenyl-1,4-benzoquinol methylase
MSLGTGRRHRDVELRHAAIEEGMRVLDVGTGTGALAELARDRTGPSGRVIGLDPSAGMLRQGRWSRCDGVQGTADRLPLADHTMDRLTMGYALRHVADLHTAFSEFHRVLRPGGRLLILEIRCPEGGWRRGLLKLYLKHLVPELARLRGREARRLMRFYWDTIERCVPPERILAALRGAGFEEPGCRMTGGVFAAYTAMKTQAR